MNEELAANLKRLHLGGLLAHWDEVLQWAAQKRLSHGGLLEYVVREECRLKHEQARALRLRRARIPEHLVINVEALEMGDVARVSDLVVPDGVRVLEDAEEVICSVVAQRAGEEEGAEEGVVAGAGEPELVGKGEAGQSAE